MARSEGLFPLYKAVALYQRKVYGQMTNVIHELKNKKCEKRDRGYICGHGYIGRISFDEYNMVAWCDDGRR
jgi:hypothetical protein